jgi:hypothetical protein
MSITAFWNNEPYFRRFRFAKRYIHTLDEADRTELITTNYVVDLYFFSILFSTETEVLF